MATYYVSDIAANGVAQGTGSGDGSIGDPFLTYDEAFAASIADDTFLLNGASAASPSLYVMGNSDWDDPADARNLDCVVSKCAIVGGTTTAGIYLDGVDNVSFGSVIIEQQAALASGVRVSGNSTGIEFTDTVVIGASAYGLRADTSVNVSGDWEVRGTDGNQAVYLQSAGIDQTFNFTGGSITGDYNDRLIKTPQTTGCITTFDGMMINVDQSSASDNNKMIFPLQGSERTTIQNVTASWVGAAASSAAVFQILLSGNPIDSLFTRLIDSTFTNTNPSAHSKYGIRMGEEDSDGLTSASTDVVVSGNTLTKVDHGFFFGAGVSNATGSRNTAGDTSIAYLIKECGSDVGWVGNIFINTALDTSSILNMKGVDGSVIANISGTIATGRTAAVISLQDGTDTGTTPCSNAQIKNLDITLAGTFAKLIVVDAGNAVGLDIKNNNFNFTTVTPVLNDNSYFTLDGVAKTATEWADEVDPELTFDGIRVRDGANIGLLGTGVEITGLTNPITDFDGNEWASTPSRGAFELAAGQSPTLTLPYSDVTGKVGDSYGPVDYTSNTSGATGYSLSGFPDGIDIGDPAAVAGIFLRYGKSYPGVNAFNDAGFAPQNHFTFDITQEFTVSTSDVIDTSIETPQDILKVGGHSIFGSGFAHNFVGVTYFSDSDGLIPVDQTAVTGTADVTVATVETPLEQDAIPSEGSTGKRWSFSGNPTRGQVSFTSITGGAFARVTTRQNRT